MLKRCIFISAGVLLIVLGLLLFKKNVIFSIPNNTHITIALNENFEHNVTACYGNKILGCKKIDVTVDSDVDTSKIGTYNVIYKANYKNYNKKIYLKVSVVDGDRPIINTENELLTVCPNIQNYDITYSAYDNYEGDITDKVLKKIYDDKIMLFVMDSFYNSDLKVINIKKEDLENPSITLNNGTSISIPLNSSYKEAGYSAYDNCEGDITDKVVVSGNVDTSKAGTYEVTYTVTDGSNNKYTIIRTVNVYKPSGNRVIYLTFDDGPSKYTGELLDILSRYNVKATFFVTGRIPSYNYNIKRAYDEGHAVGLHTNTHNYSIVYSSIDAYFDDLNTISETVKSITGEDSKIIRFPGGSSNTVSKITPGIMTSLSQLVTEKGYKYFDWNISSGDASGKVLSSDEYANNVINGLGNSSYYIVLQHDTNENSVKAVGKIIEYGLANGYIFDKLNVNSPTVHHKISN